MHVGINHRQHKIQFILVPNESKRGGFNLSKKCNCKQSAIR